MRTFIKATPGALLAGLALLLGTWFSGEAMAAGPDDPGFRKCVRCHDETSEHPVLNILLTKHGMVADSRTPMADEACTTCHGPSAAHIKDDEILPDITFREKDASVSNAQCQSCHNGKQLMHWQGSRHEAENLACVACHSAHVAQDPVLDKTQQPDGPAGSPHEGHEEREAFQEEARSSRWGSRGPRPRPSGRTTPGSS